MDAFISLLPYIIAPITALVAWFGATRMRNLSAIHKLQETINELVSKNSELYENQLRLIEENVTLKAELCEIKQILSAK